MILLKIFIISSKMKVNAEGVTEAAVKGKRLA